ncbi:hypothetical protein, partial [Burkholderia pseudomallei]|uniref:hypothetical protein n=1 Tax=Burkholderia pseudomallei TaxID=28450 RepID=UPI001E559E68
GSSAFAWPHRPVARCAATAGRCVPGCLPFVCRLPVVCLSFACRSPVVHLAGSRRLGCAAGI